MTTLLRSIYFASSILLCYRPYNLQACPLPANASCSECQAIRYIENGRNEPNVRLNVIVDLLRSQNALLDFTDAVNSAERHGFIFSAVSSISPPLETCLSEDSSRDPNIGTPCTHNLTMMGVGGALPSCNWNYTCEYSVNRFPQYLWRAQCADNAQPIFYRIPVLTVTPESEGDCLPFTSTNTVYTWRMETVAVACSCNTA